MPDTAEWINGRLVDPEHPGICVHLVGTTPGMWCSSCQSEKPPVMGDNVGILDTDNPYFGAWGWVITVLPEPDDSGNRYHVLLDREARNTVEIVKAKNVAKVKRYIEFGGVRRELT